LKWFGWVLFGSLAALVVLEMIMRILPVSTSTATGYYVDPLILSYPKYHEFTAATGWTLANAHVHRANNYGFVAGVDFARDPRSIGLVGDSYIEASMLPAEERLGTQLQQLTTPRRVFELGAPGTSALDYVERVRFAAETFGTLDFVLFMEKGDLKQMLCGSGNNAAPCLDAETLQERVVRQEPPSALKLILRKSALGQYLFSQLKLNPSAWLAGLLTTVTGAPARPSKSFDLAGPEGRQQRARMAQLFVGKLTSLPVRSIVLVLGPEWDAVWRQALLDATHGTSLKVLDATPPLQQFSVATHRSIYVSPQDKHLNGRALHVVAELVAPALEAQRATDGAANSGRFWPRFTPEV